MPQSTSKNVQACLQVALQTRDADFVYDLRHLNEGRRVQYDAFYDAAKAYIEREALAAADERRHNETCAMALAISVRDFCDRVAETLPPETHIPSVQWLAFQFAPKNPFTRAAALYTGRLPVRFLVQSRQLHHDHLDVHYAAAVFRYLVS